MNGWANEELKRNHIDQCKLPQYLRYKGRTLIKCLESIDDGDLVELKAYFDAESSIVYDELVRRAVTRQEAGRTAA